MKKGKESLRILVVAVWVAAVGAGPVVGQD